MFYSFWNRWLNMKDGIENAYRRRDSEAANMMDKAINNYLAMLGSFLYVDSFGPGNSTSSIEPLNGKERLQFIQSKKTGHFAYVQLDALYTEAMKKAVSQMAMKK